MEKKIGAGKTEAQLWVALRKSTQDPTFAIVKQKGWWSYRWNNFLIWLGLRESEMCRDAKEVLGRMNELPNPLHKCCGEYMTKDESMPNACERYTCVKCGCGIVEC